MLLIPEHNWQSLYSLIFALTLAAFFAPAAEASVTIDRASAVIFVYQRIGEDSVPQSNISVEQFEEHLRELEKGGYVVWPLERVVDTLKSGEELPQKTVALTFQGAWQSTLANAVPRLVQAKMPFTIFFASDMAEGDNPGHANWNELRKLEKNKLADLGIMPSGYVHMVNLNREQNAALINKAVGRYREEFKKEPIFFSYPYGEYSKEIHEQVAAYQFKAAFGQQSGVAHAKSDFAALPRFTMTDPYADLDRFLLTANALPLPVTDVIPADNIVIENPPMIGFTLSSEIKNTSDLSCFVSGIGKTNVSVLEGNRVEIRLEGTLQDRRSRVNCTVPDSTIIPGEPRNWRWFGMLLITKSLIDESEELSASSPGSGNEE